MSARALGDQPIDDPADDALDRSRYVRLVAQTIHDLFDGLSARFGIYGEWGEGKTSVMLMVAKDLRARGHKVAFFSPWAAATREEAWSLLLSSIRAETRTRQLRYRLTSAAASSSKLITGAAAKATHVDAIDQAGDQLAQLLAKWKKGEQIRVLRDAAESIGKKKFVVFVDDLDRTEAALLPKLLMSLREMFDIPNFVYVLGLSPTIVAEGLSATQHSSVEDGERFLEKIVEYPSYLPPITVEGIRNIVSNGAKLEPDAIRTEALLAIEPLLPRNPRRLKLFIRHLASLRYLLGRFEDTELDWPRFYATELLRLEFPSATRRLLGDDEAVKDIAARYYTKLISASENDDSTSEVPEARHAPADPIGKQRFLALCDALSTRSFETGRYGLREMLSLTEIPPVVTWREFGDLIRRVEEATANKRATIVSDWIRDASVVSPPPVVVRLVFGLSVTLRDQRMDVAVESDIQSEREAALHAASVAMSVLKIIGSDLFERRPDLLTPDEWAQLYRHTAKWSRFHHDPIGKADRDDEIAFLRALTERYSPKDALALLERIPVDDGVGHRDHSPDFVQTAKEIMERLERDATTLLVENFRIPDSLESYIGESWKWNGKYLLFDPDSPFHSPAGREQLMIVAGEAAENISVQQNFLVYVRMLLSAAFGDNEIGLARSDCRQLVSDAGFLSALWQAALAKHVNPRTLGTLAYLRKAAISEGVPETVMAYPAWVLNGDYEFYINPKD